MMLRRPVFLEAGFPQQPVQLVEARQPMQVGVAAEVEVEGRHRRAHAGDAGEPAVADGGGLDGEQPTRVQALEGTAEQGPPPLGVEVVQVVVQQREIEAAARQLGFEEVALDDLHATRDVGDAQASTRRLRDRRGRVRPPSPLHRGGGPGVPPGRNPRRIRCRGCDARVSRPEGGAGCGRRRPR